jgi:phosphopantothenoylcysteine decarboxylase/phosphopantothenate--cysteine ligase
MYDAVMRKLEWATVIVKAAAVGDFRAAQQETRKIKRESRERLCLDLEQNPDIAAAVGSRKRADQFLLGFAAETDDLVAHAQSKMIAANPVSGRRNAFGAEDNSVAVIDESGVVAEFSGTKESVADSLWDEVGKRLRGKGA